jgi:hypothetical protein
MPLVVGQPARAADGLGDVRDVAVAPEADLAPEDPKPPCPTSADGALGDDSSLAPAPVMTGACSMTNVPSGTST